MFMLNAHQRFRCLYLCLFHHVNQASVLRDGCMHMYMNLTNIWHETMMCSILKREVRFYRFSQGRVLSCMSLWWTDAGQSSADLRMHVLPKFVYCVLSDSLLYVSLKGHALTCFPHPWGCWHISGIPEVRAVNTTARPVSKTSLCGYFYSGNSFQIVWTTWLAQFSDLTWTRQALSYTGKIFYGYKH